MRIPRRALVVALTVIAGSLPVITAAAPGAAAAADPMESAPGGVIPLLAGPFAGERFVPPTVPVPETGTASANITVTYTGFTPPAQQAFQAAVDLWEQLITSSVTIQIAAKFEPLGSGVLGSAGPTTLQRSSIAGCLPQANTWYPIALANALCGVDLAPTQPDGTASFSSNFSNWYFGTDGNPGSNQYDFETVVMHELGHVLGFLGSMAVIGSQGSWGFQDSGFSNPFFPAIYDRFTENSGNQALLSFSNNSSALRAELISNTIFFDGTSTDAANGGNPAKLYDPNPWSPGSSYSHLDETTFDNTPNALMTPQLGQGEALQSPGPVTLGMFADMGWQIPVAPDAPQNVTAVEGSGEATVSFDPPVSDGGSAVTKYTVTADPGGAIGVGSGSPVNVAGLDNGLAYTFTVTATNAFGTGPAGGPSSPATPELHGYFPVDPARILDTRSGVPGANPNNTPIAPGASATIQVGGFGGVPASDVAAVVMNVTATRPTRNGWLTVWDSGGAPIASNLNFSAGQTIANLVTVKLAPDGSVLLGNTIGCTCTPGSTDVIFDVVGYFLTDGTGDEISSLPPTRILDTRSGVPGNDPRNTPLAPQEEYDVQVGGLAGVPPDASAVIMNVTATGPTKAGWLTLYPTGVGSPPTASNLNFVAGTTVPNLVAVKLSPAGMVTVSNTDGNAAAGSTNVIFDVVGYYGGTGANGGGINATTPVRILDTRAGVPGANTRSTPLAPQEAATIQIAGYGGVPMTGATAVVLNVTATGPTAAGWLTLWPAPGPPPTASNVNFLAGQTVPNLVVVALGPAGTIQLGNTNNNPASGFTNVIFDVVGWYA